MFGTRKCRLMVLGSVALTVGGVLAVNGAWAAPPVEAEVQGLYEGKGKDRAGDFKLEARVVAEGNGTYLVLVRQMRGDGKIARVELLGKTTGDTVELAGNAVALEWKGRCTACAIRGECGPDGKFELHRVDKKSPTCGKKPPQGAVVLLDGKDSSEMVRQNGAKWELDKFNLGDDGSIQVPGGGMTSKRSFEGSFDLHVEFMVPLMPSAHSQARGNSGVFLTNSDEIQVLDSFGDTTYVGGGCGGIYPYKDPDVMEVIESLKGKGDCKFTLASYPPLAWQTYDVQYRVAMKDGKPEGKPRVTVWHNGIKIHDNFEIRGAAIPYSPKGKFHFQDHGNPVRFRNIWVLPVP